jgi:riboflavin biosynthesis pyrimidine reductase
LSEADRLLPGPLQRVDVGEAVEFADRPAHADRPWVAAVFISSADGAAALGGVSGGLGGPADRAAFQAHRHMADLILAGAGTIRAERYGAPPLPDDVRARRAERGQDEVPRIAAVSGSLSFSGDEAFFDREVRPLVIAPATVDPERRGQIQDKAELLLAGDGAVDLGSALSTLRSRKVERITCEGGPRLLGSLLAADLVDELSLTIAPTLVGGSATRIAASAEEAVRAMRLAQVLCADDGYLILRYLRDQQEAP